MKLVKEGALEVPSLGKLLIKEKSVIPTPPQDSERCIA